MARSGGDGLRRREAERDLEVDMVETDDDEYDDMDRERFRGRSSVGDMERLRPRSAADLAS
jgi:hypothetical protein